MAPRGAVLRFGFGIVAAIALTISSSIAPVVARVAPRIAAPNVVPDPRIGPHTVDEILHRAHVVDLARANPIQTPRPLQAFNRAGLQKEVFGFAPYWALSQNATWDYNLLSTIAYFGLAINWDGNWIKSGGGYNGYNSQALVDMVNLAHAHGDRVLLSIESTGQAALYDVVHIPAERDLVVANVLSAIAYKNLDGVNIDFEGKASSTYPNIQSDLTAFVTQLSAALHERWPSALVTIDTYTGSASWDSGLMNIGDLAPVVDAMFVMGYDMSFGNMPGQAGPNAPLNGWTYNDTLSVSQYLTKAPASKIILGVPWYGYRFSTTSNAQYAHATSAAADSYAKVKRDLACAQNVARYWNDPGASPWAVWYSPSSGDPCGFNAGSWQELWYDDTRSLGAKYDLINRTGIRGVGIWALGYDGGAPELWSGLNTYFSCPATITLPVTEMTTEFPLELSAGTCAVRSYEVQQYDNTQNHGWYPLKTSVAQGFPGYTYDFRVRAHSMAGVVSSWSYGSTTVAVGAAASHPYSGVYTLDDYGGIHADASPPLSSGAYYSGWKIIRAGKALPGAQAWSGATLDGYGGLHTYGVPAAFSGTPYWRGWDIARDFAFLPDGSGGYVLDGFGGLHPFGVNGHAAPPAVQGGGYWSGWDIARKVVIFSDGSGGYVMDAYGGLHPFGIGRAAPGRASGAAYWAGWAIARDVALIPGSHAGYVLDGFGGVHPFSGAPAIPSPGYWAGKDLARSILLLQSSAVTAPAGWVLDAYGGVHQFGAAPAIPNVDYWPGNDVAHNLIGF